MSRKNRNTSWRKPKSPKPEGKLARALRDLRDFRDQAVERGCEKSAQALSFVSRFGQILIAVAHSRDADANAAEIISTRITNELLSEQTVATVVITLALLIYELVDTCEWKRQIEEESGLGQIAGQIASTVSKIERGELDFTN